MPYPRLSFGDYQLDLDGGALWRDGRPVSLRPRHLEVLHCLASRAGQVVSTDEILGAVWGDTFVSRGVVKVSVRHIRVALGDTSPSAMFIETVGRHGYRFAAPVTTQAISADGDGMAAPLDRAKAAGPEARIARLPFVGRGDELARLAAQLELVRSGSGGFAVLVGEPGIGKTRLLAEFAAKARAEGALVLEGRCFDGELSRAFGPFAEAIAMYPEAVAPAALRQDLAPLASVLAGIAPELCRHVSELPTLTPLAPEAERHRLFDAISQLFIAAARRAPVVVVLDDLHWADEGTLTLLRQLVRSLRRQRVLLIGAYRNVEVDRGAPLAAALADVRRELDPERLVLAGLDRTAIAELLGAIADRGVPESFVDALSEETAGNPFFVRQLLLHLIEQGGLESDSGAFPTRLSIAETGIPEGVREIIARRLSRLSEDANHFLGAASACGGPFHFDVVAAAADLDEVRALDALEAALEAQLVRETEEPEVYDFVHALIRHTLYAEMSPSRRVRLHWRVGDAIEKRFAAALEPHLSALAHHLAEGALAGDPLRAVDASLRAGDRATTLVAYEGALGHFQRALSTLDRAALSEPERRFRALMGVGLAQRALGLAAAFVRAFTDAATLASVEAWAERQAQAALGATVWMSMNASESLAMLALVDRALASLGSGDSVERALLNARRAMILDGRGSRDAGQRAAEEATAIARRLGDSESLVRALLAQSFLLGGSPDLDRRERVAREALAPASGLSNLVYAASARRLISIVAMARGERRALDRELAEFERAAQVAGMREMSAHGAGLRAALALAEGKLDEAKRLAASMRALAPGATEFELQYRTVILAARLEQGRLGQAAEGLVDFVANGPAWFQSHRVLRAALLAQLGRLEEGRAELLELARRRLWLDYDSGLREPFALHYAAEWCALAGDVERAAELESVVAPFAGQMFLMQTGHVALSAADRARGQLAATLGRLDEAVELYDSALAFEEAFGAHALAARTRYWLARALAERGGAGNLDRAHATASASRESAQRLGMADLAERAGELSARLVEAADSATP